LRGSRLSHTMIWKSKTVRFIIPLLIFAILSFMAYNIQPSDALRSFLLRWGYAGFFVVSLISGFNLFVPLFHIAFVPLLLGVGLDAIPLILLAALGTTTADGMSYLLGRVGSIRFSDSVQKFRLYIERFCKRFPRSTPFILFLWAALMPLPNELLIIPLGIVNYGAKKTLAITLLGNLAFNSFVIFTGGALL